VRVAFVGAGAIAEPVVDDERFCGDGHRGAFLPIGRVSALA
jgi:hypothetical protein